MELHDLKPAKGSKKTRKRVGRGTGSGMGKTSGRGHKGAGQHASWKIKRGHEGGQMPLHRRLPKRGFTNIHRVEFQIVNVSHLERCTGDEINCDALRTAGLIKSTRRPVKILGNGDMSKAFTVRVAAFSKSAITKIEAAGGKAEVI